MSFDLIVGNVKLPQTLRCVTIPVAPSVPIATAVVPTPAKNNLLEVIPTLYVPSISEEVVDNPVTLTISLLVQLYGSDDKTVYSPCCGPG